MAKTSAVKKATRKAAKKVATAKKSRRTLMDDLLDDQAKRVTKANKAAKSKVPAKAAALSRKIAKATGVGTTDGSVKTAAAPAPAAICKKPKFFGRKRTSAKKSSWSNLSEKAKNEKRKASREHWASLPEGHWHRTYRKELGAALNKAKRARVKGDEAMAAEAMRERDAAIAKRNAARAAESAAVANATKKTRGKARTK